MSVNWQNKLRQAEIDSHQSWLDDLEELFVNAHQRFSDISWSTQNEDEEIVHAHKAILYARAPSQFLSAYLPKQPNTLDTQDNSSSLNVAVASTLQRSPSPTPNSLILPKSTSPAILSSALKFLYTANDGESFDFLFDQPLVDRQNQDERQAKMRSDLVYMWRSTLFSDVKITLVDDTGEALKKHDSDDDDDDDGEAIFSAHRALLASRSTYFANILSPTSGFIESLQNADSGPRSVTLHQPPFTPASLHFALGYIYSGTVAFSNRTLDLSTAFEVYEAAEYLDLTPLKAQIVGKISEMVNYFDFPFTANRQLLIKRIPRILEFTLRPTINEPELEASVFELCVKGFGDIWGKDIAELPYPTRKQLVSSVNLGISSHTLIPALKAVIAIQNRLKNEMRFAKWVNELTNMVNAVDKHIRRCLDANLGEVLDSDKFWDLVDGVGFSNDAFEKLLEMIIESLNDENCIFSYQSFTSKILRNENENRVLTPSMREWCDEIRKKIVKSVRSRWMNVKSLGLFEKLEKWCLQELSEELGVGVDELLPPKQTTRRFVKKSTSSVRKEDDGTDLRTNVLKNTGRRATSTMNARPPRAQTQSTSVATTSHRTPPKAVIPPRRAGSLNTTMSAASTTPTTVRSGRSPAQSGSPNSRYPGGRRPIAQSSSASISPSMRSAASAASRTSSTTTYSKNNAETQNSPSVVRSKPKTGSQIPKPSSTPRTTTPSISSNRSANINRRMSTPSPSPSLIPTHTMRMRRISTPSKTTRGDGDMMKQQLSDKEKGKDNVKKKAEGSVKESQEKDISGNIKNEPEDSSVIGLRKEKLPSHIQKTNQDGPRLRPRPHSQSGNSVRSLAAKFESNSGDSKLGPRPSSVTPIVEQETTKDMVEDSKESNKEDTKEGGKEVAPEVTQSEKSDKENTNLSSLETPQKKPKSTVGRLRSGTLRQHENPLEDANATPRAVLQSESGNKSPTKSEHRLSNLSLVGGLGEGESDPESVAPSRIPSLSLTERSLTTQKSMMSLVEHDPNQGKEQQCTTQETAPKMVIKEQKTVEPHGVALTVGIPCIVACKPKRRKSGASIRFRALVRYLGTIANEFGPWVGVEIPSEEITEEKFNSVSGWNDGMLHEKRYFSLQGEKWNAMEPRRSLTIPSEVGGKSRAPKRSISSSTRAVSGMSSLSETSPIEEDKKTQPHKALFVRPANVVWVVNT
ncbi:hypothetical protein E3Q13_00018 [Wallemia mellicola]|nr:hypothetical protein E3Q13_00018 [Wallemia mellicola]